MRTIARRGTVVSNGCFSGHGNRPKTKNTKQHATSKRQQVKGVSNLRGQRGTKHFFRLLGSLSFILQPVAGRRESVRRKACGEKRGWSADHDHYGIHCYALRQCVYFPRRLLHDTETLSWRVKNKCCKIKKWMSQRAIPRNFARAAWPIGPCPPKLAISSSQSCPACH